MNKDTGYVKLYRALLEWEWYDDSKSVHLFIHLLITANHTSNTWRNIPIKRGQRIVTFQKLSLETGLSIQEIRTRLANMQKSNEITIKSTNKYQLLTIENYEKYQSRHERPNKQNNKQKTYESTNKQQSTNKQITSIKECKELKKDLKDLLVHEFEKLWSERPRRSGSDPKSRAMSCFNARRKDYSFDEIYNGMIRYKNFCEAEDKIQTSYVMQLATFLSKTDLHFLEAWTVNEKTQRHGGSGTTQAINRLDEIIHESESMEFRSDAEAGTCFDGEIVEATARNVSERSLQTGRNSDANMVRSDYETQARGCETWLG